MIAFRPYLHAISMALVVMSLPLNGFAASLKMFPIKGLFLAQTKNSLVQERFKGAVNPAEAGAYFDQAFRTAFPESVLSELTDKNKRHTLIVSMQVSRASHYFIDKIDGTSDVYIPVSGSLYFTNLLTGEVLYTVSATHYELVTIAGTGSAMPAERLQALFSTSYHGLVENLLNKAKIQFNPRTISAEAIQEWNGLYILNNGLAQGIAKGDVLSDAEGNTLDVLFSAAGYAIGQRSLGTISLKQAFSKETNLSLADIKKPRVMILVDKAPLGFSSESLQQLFSDALGAEAPVTVIYLNPLFSQVLSTAFTKSEVSEDESRKRVLPDFFIRLSVPESRDFEMTTNLQHKTLRTYHSIATAELVDKNGKVIYATSGQDKIVDEVTAGMSFNPESRREVSTKNALLALAHRIGSELKFDQSLLTVSSNDTQTTLNDPFGLFNQGETVVLFRDIGTVSGISEPVKIPFRESRVESISGEQVSLALDLPLTNSALAAKTGDLVILDQANSARTASRKRFSACNTVEQLGAINLPAWGDIALNIFAQQASAPFYSSQFFPELNQLLASGTRFKSTLKLNAVTTDYCVEPVYRMDMSGHDCNAETAVCTDKANVRITFRIKQGATVTAKSGLETQLTAASYQQDSTEAAQKNSLEMDLLEESSKLAKEIAVKIIKEHF